VTTTTTAGARSSLTLSVVGAPPGLTATLDNGTPTSGDSVQLTLTYASGSPSMNDVVLALTAEDGSGNVHTAGLLLQLHGTAVDDFGLSVSPVSQTVKAGSAASYTVHTTSIGTPLGLTLSADNFPAGVTNATFTPDDSPMAGQDRTLTVTTSSTASNATPADFVISATDGTVTREIVGRIGIGSPDDYTLTITPSSGSIVQGGTKQFLVGATSLSGSPTNIVITVSGLPTGVTVQSISPSSFTPPSLGPTVTLFAASNAPLVSGATFTVHGQDNAGTQRTRNAQITVGAPTVPNDFSISLFPVDVTVASGRSATVTVSTSVTSGSAETISLSASDLPQGVTGAFDPSIVVAGQTSTLTLTAAAGTPVISSMQYFVTGVASSSGHSTAGTISVANPPVVQVTSPVDGASVSGSVLLGATATAGSGATLTNIELRVDDAIVGTSASSPADASWDSRTVPDGTHTVTARATNSKALTTTSAPVTIRVNNGSGGGGCSSVAGGEFALLGLLVLCRRRWK
jgi:hypothetical protein